MDASSGITGILMFGVNGKISLGRRFFDVPEVVKEGSRERFIVLWNLFKYESLEKIPDRMENSAWGNQINLYSPNNGNSTV